MSHGVVKVSALKNRLSHYVREVRQGRVLLVCDRDQVIARIEPAGGGATTAADDAQPAGRTLHTLDVRLGAAARREGFDVPRPV